MSSRKARSSSNRGRQGRGRFYFLIPVVAVILVSSVFALSYFHSPTTCAAPASKTLAQDFKVLLTIKFVNKFGNASIYIIPRSGVGIAGGQWAVHTYDSYGSDGRYPICMDAPGSNGTSYPGASTIYVRSNTPYNYTLRDFFNVWGQPYGQNQTLSSAYVPPTKNYTWSLCQTTVAQPTQQRTGNWTYQPLVDGSWYILFYYDTQAPTGNPCG